MRGEITLSNTIEGDPLYATLREVGRLLSLERCWLFQRSFHFSLGDGWTIAVRAESAGRMRVEGCRWTRPVCTLWLGVDDRRLAGVVDEVRDMLTVMKGEARV